MNTGKFIIKYRWWILTASIIITIAFGLQIPRAKIDPDINHYIPETMTSRVNTQKIENIFGGNDMLVVVLKTEDVLSAVTLKRLKKISKSINKMDGINKTLSLFDSKSIRGENGAMIVEPAIKRIPKTSDEREILRSNLKNNDLVYKTVVSSDFTMAAVIMILNQGVSEENIITEVNSIIKETPGKEEVFLGGLPYLKAIVSKELSHDFKFLLPGGLIIMLIMLYFFFRQKRGVMLPFSVVIMAIIISMGIMPLAGWEMSIITLLLPIVLIAVANDYGIHLIARYQELAHGKTNGYNQKELSAQVFASLKIPVILTGITTLAGILSLLSHQMIPARQLGILAATGIGFALILSLLFIPAMLSFLKNDRLRFSKSSGRNDWFERVIIRFGKIVTAHPKRILGITLVVVMLTGVGLTLLKVDTNIENFFPKKHPVRTGAAIINQNFGGTQTISLLVEGDIKDPGLLNRMDFYANALEQHEGVGSVLSITDVIKEMSKAINDKGDLWYNDIPDSRNAVAQYFELYSMSGDPEDFEQLVDFDYKYAQIIVTLNDGSNTTIKNVISYARELTDGDENIKLIGGYGYVVSELADLVVRGQMVSLLLAIIAIAILVMLIFRSFSAGLISTIPLVLAIILLFGLMGILGIRLDIATALLSSMMIGIGVDYTVHFLWRYREERKNALNPENAIKKTLETTGRGIIFNALSVIIGFAVLLFSAFPPIRFFGFLTVLSISACLIGALMVIPSLLLVFKPAIVKSENRQLKKTPVNYHGNLIGKLKERVGNIKLKPIFNKHVTN